MEKKTRKNFVADAQSNRTFENDFEIRHSGGYGDDIQSKHLHYCWTWYYDPALSKEHPNHPETAVERWYNDSKGSIIYILGGYEECPTTGRKHIQGYLQLKNTRSKLSLRKDIVKYTGKHCFITNCKGNSAKNFDYCTKGGKYFSFGDISNIEAFRKGQGKRNDLIEIKDMIDKGCSMKEIADHDFAAYVKYNKAFKSYMLEKNQTILPRNFKTQVEVYWGASGSGKTRFAVATNPSHYFMMYSNGSVFFDGYQGEETVIFDDFYGGIPWALLLVLCDRYSMRVQVKGDSMNFAPKKIIFTSNKPPEEWYQNIEDKAPFYRRIDSCLRFEFVDHRGELSVTDESINYRRTTVSDDSFDVQKILSEKKVLTKANRRV